MIIEATLIGFLCYLGALSSPWLLGLTGGWYLITRPLVSGMLVGLILGDVKTGIMIGVAVQAVYIAMVTPGGSMPADLNFVAYPAIALGILSGKGPEVAVALAATIGIAGTILFLEPSGRCCAGSWRRTRNLSQQRHLAPGDELRFTLRTDFYRRLFRCAVHQ